jgi:two-component system, chemotaxis family, chemotaxis protein CheY
MRILVVDDDFASRMFFKNAVSKYGICDTASDGLEAVKAFQAAYEEKDLYKIIFLDIMMPFLDGMGVLRLIREMEKQKKIDVNSWSKIIMTSALNDKKSLDNAFYLGCDAYLAKPIELQKVIETIEKLLADK